MSPEIFIAILGVLSGVLIERIARSWGRLWCAPARWELYFWRDEGGNSVDCAPGEERRASRARYDIRIDLFNGKEIPVGLRDAHIEFRCAGVEDVVSYPEDRATERWPDGAGAGDWVYRPFYDQLSVINLPPRQWVTKDLFGTFHEQEDIRRLARWNRVELVGERQRRGLFESEVVRITIASRPPFSDPFR